MAPASPVVQQNGAAKIKRPVPPGIQTNGITSLDSSPSPSMSHRNHPASARQAPNSASDRSITASTVRPVNPARRETSIQAAGRHSRDSAGMRTSSFSAGTSHHGIGLAPSQLTHRGVLLKFRGSSPSLVVHLHAQGFRFDAQVGVFTYTSPMGIFIKHLREQTIPHELLPQFINLNVPFYDGCLIVEVHDHRPSTQTKDVAKPTSTSNSVLPGSIHNYNQYLTPSPYVAFPEDGQSLDNGTDDKDITDGEKEKQEHDKDKEAMPAPAQPSEPSEGKTVAKPQVFTRVLLPTPETLQNDLRIKISTPRGASKGNTDTPSVGPPSTPLSLVPPTPTASSMPPPGSKPPRKEKMELEPSDIYAAEGQILLATLPPLYLEPTRSVEETIALLEAFSDPRHSEPPPQPKTRKRTVAEMAADEAAAADQERYMLTLDERLGGNSSSAQGTSGADSEAQPGAATFEPRFERFKVIEDIKRDHAEKKEQEKIKQQENDRRLQAQRQEQMAQAQRQQVEADRQRRENALRENQLRQEQQRQALAARNAAAASAAQNQAQAQAQQQQQQQQQTQQTQASQPQTQPAQHAHPTQNKTGANVSNGVAAGGQNAMANNMQGSAQPRFQAQMTQAAAASSPVIRQGTPQNMSSPMVGSVPMQQTNSSMATSPPRPPSVVQNGQMSVPMAHNMSARGSQQSHPSGTPRMPNSTPNMAHGTPINRQAMAATPRMSQASPPPNMMAQNSQMGQAMMMNQQGMNHNQQQMFAAQMAAQQRAIAQQQQQQLAALQNGGANGGMNTQGITPQQQQVMQMMQRQMLMQQQQQQQQQQGGMMTPQQQQQLAQQYAQLQQNMQNNQLRQMTPQMQAQIQQIARMGQMGNPMQRQVSGQMMNGNNANMQAFAAMQMQQQQQHPQQQHQQHQQQQHQQQQHQHQQQQQQQGQPQQQQQQGQPQQPQMGANPLQAQIQLSARQIYSRLMQGAVAKFGSAENVPQDTIDKMKQSSFIQAQQMLQQSMAQRRAQQQQMMLQQQQQQQAAMQGMGGMMGHQGM